VSDLNVSVSRLVITERAEDPERDSLVTVGQWQPYCLPVVTKHNNCNNGVCRSVLPNWTNRKTNTGSAGTKPLYFLAEVPYSCHCVCFYGTPHYSFSICGHDCTELRVSLNDE
jgi:hypothetical protein